MTKLEYKLGRRLSPTEFRELTRLEMLKKYMTPQRKGQIKGGYVRWAKAKAA